MLITEKPNASWQLSLAQLSPSLSKFRFDWSDQVFILLQLLVSEPGLTSISAWTKAATVFVFLVSVCLSDIKVKSKQN